MKSLRRALRMSLKYRWSLAVSIVFSFFVALFWGANLGAVYPFIEVVLHNKSLHEWADDRIAQSIQEIAERKLEIEQCRNERLTADDDSRAAIETRIFALTGNIKLQEQKIDQTNKLKPWIQAYAPDDPFETLKLVVLFMILGTLARGIFLAGNMYLVARVSQRTILDMQNQIFQNVLRMEMSEIGVKGTGDLINRIRGETMAIGAAIRTLYGQTIREPMKMGACLLGAAWVNWRLLLFSMIVCPVAMAIMVALARQAKKASRRAMEDSAHLLNRLYQALMYLRIVKSNNMQPYEAGRFQLIARDVYKKAMRIALFNALSRTNNELLSVLVIGLSVLAGGYLVLNQQTHLFGVRMSSMPMDFGQVVLFFAFLIGAVDPLRKLGDVYTELQVGIVAADRVFPIIDQVPQVMEPANPKSLVPSPRSIEFCSVWFSYEPDLPVLRDVSFEVPAGSSLAIIGQNGCGKSTLINLLPRFFDPDSGQISINGLDLKQLSLKDIREDIGYVTQTTMLFGDSVAANISYGSPGATHAEIEAAAKRAHAHSFISQMDQGYESQIGEHGNKLSGGQRQRLSLARAILKNPRILILDEATSQIDNESEQLILDAMREFMKGRTTLIVTHRMATLELVDRILVLAEGRVIDCGTHEELISRCSAYRRLRNLALEVAA